MSSIAKTILEGRIRDEVIAEIAGNASHEVKAIPLKWLEMFRSRKGSFARNISGRLKVTEVSVIKKSEDQCQMEGRVVCHIDVTEDMLNGAGILHEGCAVFLIDECSACSLATLNMAEGRNIEPGVSQAINTVFHNPAKLGTRLKIVNTTMTALTEMASCRSEIWDTDRHQLVATGVHLQMMPSKPHKWVSKI